MSKEHTGVQADPRAGARQTSHGRHRRGCPRLVAVCLRGRRLEQRGAVVLGGDVGLVQLLDGLSRVRGDGEVNLPLRCAPENGGSGPFSLGEDVEATSGRHESLGNPRRGENVGVGCEKLAEVFADLRALLRSREDAEHDLWHGTQ